jgi:hypothetical protein
MTVGAGWPAYGRDPGPGVLRASIVTPGDWVELDLEPTTRHKSIRRAVRNAVRRKTVRQPDAVRLIRRLEQIAARAQDNGAFFCASQVVADDPARDPLVANVMMQVVPYELPGELAFRSPPDMCDWLADSIRDECGCGDYGDGDVDIVPLPRVGPAVRHEVMSSGVLVQYFVPLPVLRPTALVLLTFTCPCPPYAELTTKLFDVIATSLSLDVT